MADEPTFDEEERARLTKRIRHAVVEELMPSGRMQHLVQDLIAMLPENYWNEIEDQIDVVIDRTEAGKWRLKIDVKNAIGEGMVPPDIMAMALHSIAVQWEMAGLQDKSGCALLLGMMKKAPATLSSEAEWQLQLESRTLTDLKAGAERLLPHMVARKPDSP